MNPRQVAPLSAPQATPLEEHRRQMLWQIWAPLALGLLIFFALMVLTLIGAARQSSLVEKWGNLSAIYLLIPVLFIALIVLAILGGCIYGLMKLLKNMPGWMLTARIQILRVALLLRRGMDAVTKPVFVVNETMARAEGLKRSLGKNRNTNRSS